MTYFTKMSLLGTLLFTLEPVQAEEPNNLILGCQQDQISDAALQLAQDLYEAFEPYLLESEIDACAMGLGCATDGISTENKHKLIQRLAIQIQQKRPIELNLVAFPFKSGNRDRQVITYTADMAEFKSLEYLDSMRAKLSHIYPQVKLTIYTDGLLFNDLFEIPETHVRSYEVSFRQLLLSFPDIKFVTFTEMLNNKGLQLDRLRAESDRKATAIAVPEEKVILMKERIKREINHSGHSFSKLSHEKQNMRLNTLTNLILGRVETARAIIREFEQPGSFSLSAHYQKDFDKKIGIKLLPGSIVTPPNGVLVESEDGSSSVRHRNQIDSTTHTLTSVIINNIACPYFCWR